MIRLTDQYKVGGDELYYFAGRPGIPAGTITIQETKAPVGYALDPAVYTVHFIEKDGGIRSDKGDWRVEAGVEDLTVLSEEMVYRGAVSLTKTSASGQVPEGDASLAGIRFALINRSAGEVSCQGGSYAAGQVIAILTADANGKAATADRSLPYGTYELAELRQDAAIAPGEAYDGSAKLGTSALANAAGYRYQAQSRTVSVTADGQVAEASFTDEAVKGGLAVTKQDAEAEIPQGDADFSGIVFEVINRSPHPVCVNGATYAPGETVVSLTADATGHAATAADLLPYGTYGVREVKSNDGYRLTDGDERVAAIRENGILVSTDTAGEPLIFRDEVIRGGVKVAKMDAETGKAVPQGWGTFAGTEYTIWNESANPVVVDGKTIAPGEAAAVLTAGEDGTAETPADFLPYGTYAVTETAAPEGYVLNREWRASFAIREDGEVADLTTEDTLPEDIRRADLCFWKVDIDGKPMAYVPFLIERLNADGTVAESHVIATDENGYLNTADRPKTGEAVNRLDDCVSAGQITDEAALKEENGIWFGEESAQDEARGALLYANYRITELGCAANRTHDRLMQVMIDEDDLAEMNAQFRDGRIFTLTDIFVDLEIHPETDLVDAASGTQTVSKSAQTLLTDTIRYDHLKTYNTYRVVTEIWYEETEGAAPVLAGTGETVFTPQAIDDTETASGTVTVDVTLDTTGMTRGKLHAADRFYVRLGEDWVLLLSHNDGLDDPRQTVGVAWMKTTAKDTKTGGPVGTATKDAGVSDTVTYECLSDGLLYRFEATLRYADTGEVVRDAAGEPCVVTLTAHADASVTDITEKDYGLLIPLSGEMTMPAFTFDASGLGGRRLVVTEVLYLADTDEAVLRHEDLSDEAQSVRYPGLSTTAVADDTNGHTTTAQKELVITDTVRFTNLVTDGKPVTIRGTLYDRETGKPVMVSGQEVTAEKSFVPEASEGEIRLTFVCDGSELGGRYLVAAETLWLNGVLTAEHADLHDDAQTVFVEEPEQPTEEPTEELTRVPETPQPAKPVTGVILGVEPDVTGRILTAAGLVLMAAGLMAAGVLLRQKRKGRSS